jgi:probable rRNA maturation factor
MNDAEADGGGVQVELQAPGGERIPEAALRAALERVFAREGVEGGELSITFLADAPIHALNLRWLDHDWVPDVLSFPMEPPLLGDVYVGHAQALRQAREHGVPPEEELVRLAVHGTLHLLGHDHPEDADGRAASEHTRIQEAILREVFG